MLSYSHTHNLQKRSFRTRDKHDIVESEQKRATTFRTTTVLFFSLQLIFRLVHAFSSLSVSYALSRLWRRFVHLGKFSESPHISHTRYTMLLEYGIYVRQEKRSLYHNKTLDSVFSFFFFLHVYVCLCCELVFEIKTADAGRKNKRERCTPLHTPLFLSVILENYLIVKLTRVIPYSRLYGLREIK